MSNQLRSFHVLGYQAAADLRGINYRLYETNFHPDWTEIMTITCICLVAKDRDLRCTAILSAEDIPALQTNSDRVSVFAKLHICPIVEAVLPLCRLRVQKHLHHF